MNAKAALVPDRQNLPFSERDRQQKCVMLKQHTFSMLSDELREEE
jgi:hypothetical protein